MFTLIEIRNMHSNNMVVLIIASSRISQLLQQYLLQRVYPNSQYFEVPSIFIKEKIFKDLDKTKLYEIKIRKYFQG